MQELEQELKQILEHELEEQQLKQEKMPMWYYNWKWKLGKGVRARVQGVDIVVEKEVLFQDWKKE